MLGKILVDLDLLLKFSKNISNIL